MDFLTALKKSMGLVVDMYQESHPNFRYSFDGADGHEFWQLDVAEDELTPHHRFTASQFLATDWVLVMPETL